MKIGDLLIGRGKSMVDYKVDLGRVPKFLHAHFIEHFDCKRPGAVLGHSEVGVENCDVAWVERLLSSLSSRADNLLSERQRIIVQYALLQACRTTREAKTLLNVKQSIRGAFPRVGHAMSERFTPRMFIDWWAKEQGQSVQEFGVSPIIVVSWQLSMIRALADTVGAKIQNTGFTGSDTHYTLDESRVET